MDELSLTLEGIKNKVQKLFLRNSKLLARINELENEKQQLEEQLENQLERSRLIEEELTSNQLAFAADKAYTRQAKQKVNEMLREIDKCYALLNR